MQQPLLTAAIGACSVFYLFLDIFFTFYLGVTGLVLSIPAFVIGRLKTGYLGVPTNLELAEVLQDTPLGRQALALCILLRVPYSGLLFPTVIALEVKDGKVHVAATLRNRPYLRNIFGTLHAAALTNFGEFVGGMAVLSAVQCLNQRRAQCPSGASAEDAAPLSAIVSSLQSAFVKPGRSGILTASASVAFADIMDAVRSPTTPKRSGSRITDAATQETAPVTPTPGSTPGHAASLKLNVYSQVSDDEGSVIAHVNSHWRCAFTGQPNSPLQRAQSHNNFPRKLAN